MGYAIWYTGARLGWRWYDMADNDMRPRISSPQSTRLRILTLVRGEKDPGALLEKYIDLDWEQLPPETKQVLEKISTEELLGKTA